MVPIEHVYDQIRAFAADAGARKSCCSVLAQRA